MKKQRYGWLLTLLRYGLCLAAIAYLIATVKWSDYLTLKEPVGARARIIETLPDGFRIERAGRIETIPRSAVSMLEIGGKQVLDIDLGIRSVARSIQLRELLIAILLFMPVPLFSAVRLVWMLAIQDVRLRLWNSIKLTFAGNFFNFALPGTTGGDLIKAYYVTRFTDRKTEAVTTIFLDRVIGLLSVVLMAGVLILFTPNVPRVREIGMVLTVALAGLAIGAIFIISRRLRHALRLPQLAARLPMGQHILRIGRTLIAMRQHPALLTLSLAITFGLQSLALIAFCFLARALGMEGTFTQFFIYIAIGFLIAAVPISPPQAIGVLEFAYIQFFTPIGANSSSQAVALALGVRLIQLLWALPGVLVPIFGAHLPSQQDLDQLADDADASAGSANPVAVAAAPKNVVAANQ